ncbi:MAG: ThiF family adenylyltransferase [Mariprofundus sp.]|nr:ThiF family adenylyltransferase [Mariprofundus sp.]
MIQAELNEVISQIKSPHLISWAQNADDYSFVLKRRKQIWNVKLKFPANFPFELPSAFLLDTNLIGSLPHVNFAGHICVTEDDSLLWNYHRPVEVLESLLCNIVKLLDDAILKESKAELTDEYEGYFHCCTSFVNSFYKASGTLGYVHLKIFQSSNRKKKARPVLLNNHRKEYQDDYSNLNKVNNQVIKIIHMPLSEAVLPPKANAKISVGYIFDLKKFLSDQNKNKLDQLLHQEKHHMQFFVLLSMPRTSGERSQLLLNFTTEKGMPHPLLERSDEWSVELFLLARNNKEYLLERGGAENSLLNKKVAIVGCGSLGSEIALMLSKAGVGELTLIDHDLLVPDNIYRHRLGGLSLNYLPDKKTGEVKPRSKVNALAALMRFDFPYITANPIPQLFCNITNDKDLLSSDLVIIAVGSPALNLQINRQLKGLNINNVIFCWNEAVGIGGHSVLLNLRTSCLECLYSGEDGFSNGCQLGLLKNGQKISKNLTGCAGTFTPFSYLDSSQTAAMASKHAVDHLLLGIHSKAMSWRGENHAGLQVTERYNKIALKEEIELIRENGCEVCCE